MWVYYSGAVNNNKYPIKTVSLKYVNHSELLGSHPELHQLEEGSWEREIFFTRVCIILKRCNNIYPSAIPHRYKICIINGCEQVIVSMEMASILIQFLYFLLLLPSLLFRFFLFYALPLLFHFPFRAEDVCPCDISMFRNIAARRCDAAPTAFRTHNETAAFIFNGIFLLENVCVRTGSSANEMSICHSLFARIFIKFQCCRAARRWSERQRDNAKVTPGVCRLRLIYSVRVAQSWIRCHRCLWILHLLATSTDSSFSALPLKNWMKFFNIQLNYSKRNNMKRMYSSGGEAERSCSRFAAARKYSCDDFRLAWAAKRTSPRIMINRNPSQLCLLTSRSARRRSHVNSFILWWHFMYDVNFALHHSWYAGKWMLRISSSSCSQDLNKHPLFLSPFPFRRSLWAHFVRLSLSWVGKRHRVDASEC